MKPTRHIAVIVTGLLFLNGHAGTWSEKVIAEVGANRIASAKRLVLEGETGCGIITGYANLKHGFASNPGLAKSAAKLDREIQFVLKRNFSNSCFTAYRDYVADSTKPESARIPVLQLMMGQDHVLSAGNKTALGICLGNLLGRAATSAEMKSRILLGIGKYASGADCSVYSGYFNAGDSLLRQAAYQGLARRVNKNRLAGDSLANRGIFNALVGFDSASANILQFKVIATISENYSRNYLLPRCSGNPIRLKEIFHRDADLVHPGILKKALEALSQNPDDESLKKAIRYGTKDPWAIAQPLLAGNVQDKEAGMRLLELFPKVALDHEAAIEAAVQNGNAEAQ